MNRPKRERKLPAHLKTGDFEYSYKGPVASAANKRKAEAAAAAAAEALKSADPESADKPAETEIESNLNSSQQTEIEDEIMNDSIPDFENENESVAETEDDDFNTDEDTEEDDPNKLWCICQQPHNNRFMICCDECSDWYHGKCVGITKKMGKEMEEAGNEWTCPKCISKTEKEVTDKQTIELKNKLKEREEKNSSKQGVTGAALMAAAKTNVEKSVKKVSPKLSKSASKESSETAEKKVMICPNLVGYYPKLIGFLMALMKINDIIQRFFFYNNSSERNFLD